MVEFNGQSKFQTVAKTGYSEVQPESEKKIDSTLKDFFSGTKQLVNTLRAIKDLPGSIEEKAVYIKHLFDTTKDPAIKDKTGILGFALYSKLIDDHLINEKSESKQLNDDIASFRAHFESQGLERGRKILFGSDTASHEVFQTEESASLRKIVGQIWNKICERLKSLLPTISKTSQPVKASIEHPTEAPTGEKEIGFKKSLRETHELSGILRGGLRSANEEKQVKELKQRFECLYTGSPEQRGQLLQDLGDYTLDSMFGSLRKEIEKDPKLFKAALASIMEFIEYAEAQPVKPMLLGPMRGVLEELKTIYTKQNEKLAPDLAT